MKEIRTLLVLASALCMLFAEDPVEVTVLGDRVNLRTDKTLESDVVSQADYGDTLQAVSFEPDWVEVRPPEGFAAWVYSPLLFEDKEVRAPTLNIRSGPGTQFIIVGELERGDVVEVVEALEEWRRITPPDAVRLWISREFVQVPPSVLEAESESEPEPEPQPVPEPEHEPVPVPTPITIIEVRTIEKIVEVPVQPTPTPAVEAPGDLDLIPLEGQGTLSKRRGRVQAYLLSGRSPSRFMLVIDDGRGGEKALCYLRGDEEKLKASSGKWVTVSGRDFWVTGQRLPVTEVEEIEVRRETP
ncbi:MAG: SH3 domain-containing protein [Kiritimatiellae bacterium]|jgi:SH3-like domain-containing protein|nr:SH3 domain-containing protein [Kiritimatiellia bacterium]